MNVAFSESHKNAKKLGKNKPLPAALHDPGIHFSNFVLLRWVLCQAMVGVGTHFITCLLKLWLSG